MNSRLKLQDLARRARPLETPRAARSAELDKRLQRLLQSVGYDIDRHALVGDLPTAEVAKRDRGFLGIGLVPEDRAAQGLIKAASVKVPVSELSVGNAQKVSVAKWLTPSTRVLLLDEPTVGVDIGAKTEILRCIRDFAANGGGVVRVPSEFEELLAICDRIFILRGGSIVAVRQSEETNEQELILLAGGTAASGPPCDDSAASTTITASPEMSRILGAVPSHPPESSSS